MTQQEVNEASDALMRWFESQTITPRMAEIVMSHALASLIIFHQDGDEEACAKRLLHWTALTATNMNHMRHE